MTKSYEKYRLGEIARENFLEKKKIIVKRPLIIIKERDQEKLLLGAEKSKMSWIK